MKHWTPDEAVADVDTPDEVVEIIDRLEAEFLVWNGPWPRVTSVGQSDGADDDCWRYEVLVELAPGAILPVETGFAELIDRSDEFGDDEPTADDVVEDVMEGVEACMGDLRPTVGDLLHVARLRSRRTVAAWIRDGMRARVVDVRLAPYGEWRGGTDPGLQVLIETLDDMLAPAVELLRAENLDGLDDALAEARAGLEFRQRRAAELNAEGASGSIDALALKAVALTGRPEAVLRRFAVERRVDLADGTALHLSDGHVSLNTRYVGDHVEICDQVVTVDAAAFDPAALKRAPGRPIIDLIHHHYLSDDVIVSRVAPSMFGSDQRLDIMVDAPRSFFCAVSGRCWTPQPAAAAAGPIDEGDTGSSVVPFRRRVA